jgi:ABC-type amino acid transport system permease subunit
VADGSSRDGISPARLRCSLPSQRSPLLKFTISGLRCKCGHRGHRAGGGVCAARRDAHRASAERAVSRHRADRRRLPKGPTGEFLLGTVLARLIDVVLSVPFLLVAIALVSVTGPSLTVTVLVIGFFSWASVARIVRGQVLSLREREFVEAARSLGASDTRIMFVDVLPNVLAPVIVYTTLLIPVVIVVQATLSFLGLGLAPPTPDWGGMISEAQAYYTTAWWFIIFPGAALLITTLAFNLFGDGVRDAFDPRTERLLKK